jgi:hypothetical protein
MGFVVVAGNSILAYTVLRRLGGQRFALAGALGVALYPADTTPLFIYHSLGLQQSLMWFWLATHAYLSNRRAIAYLLILGSLLSYETVFPVFLAAPLLGRPWDRRLIRRTFVHALILAALFAGVLALRIAVGERRVTELGFPEILTTPLLHMMQGPLVSMGTYFYRPVQTLLAIDPEILVAIALTAPVFAVALLRLPQESGVSLRALLNVIRRPAAVRGLSSETQKMLRLGVSGLFMLVLAYPLTFTTRAYAISGRDTRVHLAAVLGASIVWGCFCWFLLAFAEAKRRRWLAALPLAILLGFLVGFGFLVQKDYARSWSLQRAFWTDVLRLSPDLEEGTVILVEPEGLVETRHIDANTWNLPRILDQILTFPEMWETPPRVFRLRPGWEDRILTEDGGFILNGGTVAAPPSLYTEVASNHVIFLDWRGEELVRRTEPFLLGEAEFALKPIGSAAQGIGRGFLYPFLVEGQ